MSAEPQKQKVRNPLLLSVSLALIFTSVLVFFSGTRFMRNIELICQDTLFQLRGSRPVQSKIVIITIDDQDMVDFGRWPWPRNETAQIIKALDHFGAAYIHLDMLFTTETEKEEDRVFVDAMKEADNVYLPFAFQPHGQSVADLLEPIEDIAKYNKGSGFINMKSDIDGKIRKVSLVHQTENEIYPHLSLRMAMDYLGMEFVDVTPHFVKIADQKLEINIPIIEKNQMVINWYSPWNENFTKYSYRELKEAYLADLNNEPVNINVALIKGSFSFAAVTAYAYHDIYSMPLQNYYPGVGIHATVFNNIVNQQFIHVVPVWIQLLFIYFLALIPPLFQLRKGSFFRIWIAIFGVVLFASIYFLFLKGWLINSSLPVIAFIGSYIIVATYNYSRVSIERRKFIHLANVDGLTQLYNIRYFKMILKTEFLMAKSDPNSAFCVMICDIDHFKTLNDQYGHQTGDRVIHKVAGLIKACVREEDLVARYGGDEMILLLKNISLKSCMKVAEKMRSTVESVAYKDLGLVKPCTLSIGAAAFHQDEADEQYIILRADKSLYEAKRKGRNRVEADEA